MEWTQESAEAEFTEILSRLLHLQETGYPSSPEHIHWSLRTFEFLKDVFGEASPYFSALRAINWRYRGTIMLRGAEMYDPLAAQRRYDLAAYVEAVGVAAGVLHAALDDLKRKGLDAVYKSKTADTSLLRRVQNLAEFKLRMLIRSKPKKERDIQDAFEDLLNANDIVHSREKDSIEYSSKTYTPDFSVPEADLAVEIKLANAETHEKLLIAQINDDITAYGTKYGNILFVVYDCGFIRDVERFVRSFEANGSVVVRVVKH